MEDGSARRTEGSSWESEGSASTASTASTVAGWRDLVVDVDVVDVDVVDVEVEVVEGKARVV